jgi:hypothetical protein
VIPLPAIDAVAEAAQQAVQQHAREERFKLLMWHTIACAGRVVND